MKKWFKVFSMATATIVSLSLFAGCAKTEVKDPEKPAANQEPVKLVIWGGVPEESGPNEMVEEFNKLNNGITIEYVRYVNDESGNTKLDMALMSGSEIDIFMNYNLDAMVKRIKGGSVEPLDDLMKKVGMDMKSYFGDDVEKTKVDDKYYFAPTQANKESILFNAKMFDDAGIPYPKAGWTYDEFYDAAKKLSKGSGQDKVYGYYYSAWGGGAPAVAFAQYKLGPNWLYSADGKSSNLDHPDVRFSFEEYMKRTKEGIEPTFVDNTTQKMNPQDLLLKERAAMVHGTWIIRHVKNLKDYPHDFKVGFATMPKLSKDQPLYIDSYGDFMSINSKSKNKEAAAKFIKWYCDGGMLSLVKFGRIPSSSKIDPDKAYQAMFGDTPELFDEKTTKEVLFKPYHKSIRTIHTAGPEISTILTEEFEKAFAGAQSVDDAIKNAKKRADERITKELTK
jgi:multiple sugar transport system substrate-binding protein